jgi:hypothetical protein
VTTAVIRKMGLRRSVRQAYRKSLVTAVLLLGNVSRVVYIAPVFTFLLA